jgi:hypothetical protein
MISWFQSLPKIAFFHVQLVCRYAAVIVASGMGASKAAAQEQVAVGMGTLAGSTVMLLTIAWSGSLWVGRCDLNERGLAIPKTMTHGAIEGLGGGLYKLNPVDDP